MATEQRISRLEGAYEQVDARLSDTNQRIDSLSSRVNALQANTLESSMNARFNTLTILTVGGWVALMAAIVALFFAK
jgi:membrane glycosyltransferase